MTPEQILNGLLMYAVLLFSLVFHECAHAWIASRCGDDTAKLLGRVTLNPLPHMDLFGTVIFPLIQIFGRVPMIGWAKPVPYDPRNLRNPRRDDLLIALGGPGSNLLLALVSAVLFRLDVLVLGGYETGIFATAHDFVAQATYIAMRINILLAFFNLIPIAPLDGSSLITHILPPHLAIAYRRFGTPWGFMVLLLLLFTGAVRQYLNFGESLVSPVLNALAGARVV